MAELDFTDVIGVVGTLLVSAAYLGTQMRWMNSDDLSFPLLNLAGALMIGYSLWFKFNLASALMEGVWVLVSVIGIFQYFHFRRR